MRDEHALTLSFGEIETILGIPLAATPRVDQWGWRALVLVAAWRAIGWETRPERERGSVVWRRMAA